MANPPLFILCPPRSYSSVTCSMLGEHPELYGLPEVNLFFARTVGEFLDLAAQRGRRVLKAGVLRTLAELHSGVQTEETVNEAEAWLRERPHWPLCNVFYHIAELVAPRRCVDKSPTNARAVNLRRLLQAFPDSPLLHLSRHPRSTGKSMWKARSAKGKRLSMPFISDVTNVERSWRDFHERILELAAQLPSGQIMYLQGELLMSDPDFYLPQICDWLGIGKSPEAIEAMKHPETSPYACLGPMNALGGNNRGFLEDPRLRIGQPPELDLEGPLEWLDDGGGFSARTLEVARQLGYH